MLGLEHLINGSPKWNEL